MLLVSFPVQHFCIFQYLPCFSRICDGYCLVLLETNVLILVFHLLLSAGQNTSQDKQILPLQIMSSCLSNFALILPCGFVQNRMTGHQNFPINEIALSQCGFVFTALGLVCRHSELWTSCNWKKTTDPFCCLTQENRNTAVRITSDEWMYLFMCANSAVFDLQVKQLL